MYFSEVHTNEKPHKCPECEYSFTHVDYLSEHRREKHANELSSHLANKKLKATPQSNLNRSSAIVVVSSNGQGMTSETASAVASITQKSAVDITDNSVSYTPVRGRKPVLAQPVPTEFKCSFPDCGFVTNSQEKLDFHVKAHTNTKVWIILFNYILIILLDYFLTVLLSYFLTVLLDYFLIIFLNNILIFYFYSINVPIVHM